MFDEKRFKKVYSQGMGTTEIWVLEAGIHCTMLGAGPDDLSADFPYYIERKIKIGIS